MSVTIKQLLDSGAHFGHQTQRWNPKMKPYIFGDRNGIHIINLEITAKVLERALKFLREITKQGDTVLFVGTKKQAQDPLMQAAQKSNMPFVNERWLGGMLTNFETIRKSIKKIEEIDRMEKMGEFQYVTKKEASSLCKEREKLVKNLSGVREMKKLPGALFIIDIQKEKIAVLEARKLGIPIVAIADTNSDPELVDIAIPGNDDAVKAITVFCDAVANIALEGGNEFRMKQNVENKPEADSSVDAAAEEALNSSAKQ